MSTLARTKLTPATNGERIPPLQSGDRLTRDEFERRYKAMPCHTKAELIDGVVYMPSPVTFGNHGRPHFELIGWLFLYRCLTLGVLGGDNATLRLDLENEPQPDAFLIIEPSLGGQVQIDEDNYIVGAPELVAEVAATSANYDLNVKLEAYRRNGVQEYVVWRVFDREIDWFVLRMGQYVRLALSADGLYKSEVFPGVWLAPVAMIESDLGRIQQVVQQGAATPEHAAFVERLQQARGPQVP
jgi:Uma2 family endonuclease